jgi:hypothetical protein
LKKYNLTMEEYEAMVERQRGRCRLCGTENPGTNGEDGHWCVDHDHSCCPGKGSCGKCVRGLLCVECNVGLGKFKDNPALLRAAVAYLEAYLENPPGP